MRPTPSWRGAGLIINLPPEKLLHNTLQKLRSSGVSKRPAVLRFRVAARSAQPHIARPQTLSYASALL